MTHRVLVALSVVLGVALALAQPLAGRAGAHPAAPTARAVAAHASGKSSGPSVDLTLHLDYPLTFFQNPSFNAFGEPERMGTDAQGDVFVSQESGELVSMFAAGDYFVRNFGSGTQGTGNGSFHRPTGVTATGGVVYVADYYNGLIQTFNQTTTNFISQFGPPHLGNPAGMVLGSNGNLYVVDEYNDDVVEFSTSGT